MKQRLIFLLVVFVGLFVILLNRVNRPNLDSAFALKIAVEIVLGHIVDDMPMSEVLRTARLDRDVQWVLERMAPGDQIYVNPEREAWLGGDSMVILAYYLENERPGSRIQVIRGNYRVSTLKSDSHIEPAYLFFLKGPPRTGDNGQRQLD